MMSKHRQASVSSLPRPGQRTVLCVDDERARTHIRQLVLQSVGYRVLGAFSGDEGLRIFRSEPVDAVLLDLHMPDMAGDAVARTMKKVKPQVPIVMLSGQLAPPIGARRVIDAFLVKGTPPQQLLERLATLMHVGAHTHEALNGEYVAAVDHNRRYVDVTDGVCRLLGYTRDELLSMKIEQVTAPQTADVTAMFEDYRHTGTQRGTYVLRHRSGRPVLIRYHALIFPDGCMVASWEPLPDPDPPA